MYMTDYSKMSDLEINGRVAKATQKIGDFTQARGKAFIHEHKDVGEFKNICIGWKEYDPCNNPADAWPIIVTSKIWLREMYGMWDCKGFPNQPHPSGQVSSSDANPLRAAMIVFLMMKESENV
jgi:hypothetical protein